MLPVTKYNLLQSGGESDIGQRFYVPQFLQIIRELGFSVDDHVPHSRPTLSDVPHLSFMCGISHKLGHLNLPMNWFNGVLSDNSQLLLYIMPWAHLVRFIVFEDSQIHLRQFVGTYLCCPPGYVDGV